MLLNFEVGGKYTVTEKTNPHTNKKESLDIIVLSTDGRDGFYCYNVKNNYIMHSNIFVWVIDSVKFQGMQDLEKKEYNGVSWLTTGIDSVDFDMGNLGVQYKLFCELAPKKLFKKYERQENNNNHKENGKMVMNFLDFIIAGGDPNLFN
jgi:hypothetical protein